MYRVLSSTLCVLMLSACGAGSGVGLDANGLPIGSAPDTPTVTPPPTPTGSVSLAQLQAEIFTPECSECHTGSNAPQGLRLDSLAASATSLSRPSNQLPNLLLADPMNPDESYLVRKIEGGPDIVGSQMPLGGTPLSNAQMALVRAWISGGAPSASAGTPTVVQKVNIDDAIDTVSFSLALNREIDASTVSHDSIFVFVNDGETQTLANADDVVFDVNSSVLTVTYLGSMENADSLEVELNNTSSQVLLDVDGGQIEVNNEVNNNGVSGEAYRYVYAL